MADEESKKKDAVKKKKPKKNKAKKGDPEISVYESLPEEENTEASESGVSETDINIPTIMPEDSENSENSEVTEESDEKPKFKFNLFKKLSLKTLYIIAGVMLFIIVGLAVFALVFTKMKAGSNYSKNAVFLELPESRLNSANYIFTSTEMEINGGQAKLLGVLVDSQTSIFYFDRYFEADCLDFMLRDSAGNIYYMDLSRHMSGTRTDKLYFQPLAEGILSFEMILPKYVNTLNGDLVFQFNKPLELPTAYYTENQSVVLGFEGAEAVFKIDEAVFSSSGTFIDYSFSSADDRIKIMPDKKSTGFIKARDNSSVISPLSGYALQESANDTLIMGREGFRPLTTLTGMVTFTIRDLLCQFKINKTVETDELFLNNPENMREIRLGDYKLVLERMGKRGNTYAVVLHTEDLTLPVPTELGDFSNRVYASYDIELVGKNKDGRTVSLASKSYISKVGADFVFIDEEKEIVYNSPEDVQLKINTAEIKMDDAVFDLDLSELSEERDERTKKALEAILMLYEYDNRDLETYTAQIMSHSVSDNELSALVYEAGIKDGEFFSSKHAIIGVMENGIVDILSELEL